MRIVAVSCVKNEADIVEAFVRHTLAHVEHLVVLDNGSTDSTPEVLRLLVRDGLPIHLVADPSPGYWQAQRMTRLMREFAIDRLNADWVLPLDADEFIATAEGAQFSPADLPFESTVRLASRTYVPGTDDDQNEINPVRRIRHRLVREPRAWYKVAIPGALARRADATLAQGNHALNIGERLVEQVPVTNAWLAHFPGRSANQLLAKVVIGHFQYVAMEAKHPRWGYQYNAPYEMIKRDVAAFAASYRDIVLHYTLRPDQPFVSELVDDPVRYAGESLKYTPPSEDNSYGLGRVFEYVDALAEHYAETAQRLDDIEASNAREIQRLREEHTAALIQAEQLLAERDREIEALRRSHAD